MNTLLPPNPNPLPAHPLFPVDQALLWLPGLPGEQLPFCTHNEMRGVPGSDKDRWLTRNPATDENGAYYAPPYPVSTETFIAWHTNFSPPFPFHPIPVSHTLSMQELNDLAVRVMRLLGRDPAGQPRPLDLLKNDNKCMIIAALASMGLLSRPDCKAS